MRPGLAAALALLAACAGGKQSWREAAPPPEVFLDVLPRTADVIVDGHRVGKGPQPLALGDRPMEVQFVAEGFEGLVVSVDAKAAGSRVGVALRPSGWGTGRTLDIDEPIGLAAAASVLLRAGLALEASQYAERAAEVAPVAPQPHRVAGFAHLKLGRKGRAAQELSRYLELAPDAADREEIERLVGQLRGDFAISPR